MKKKTVLNLIRYHVENNEPGFKQEALEIAKYFDSIGDTELSWFITSLLSGEDGFVPQSIHEMSDFFQKIFPREESLYLPKQIVDETVGIANAINKKAGLNKFLFYGDPGTGKTETAKYLAKMLNRELFIVDFSRIIDSKLGQTQKNIVQLFNEINSYDAKAHVLFLFDEIDALVLDRTNPNDLREMGRATSTFLRCLDNLSSNAIIIATTNLYKHFDSAIKRRFDASVNFNCYTSEDKLQLASSFLTHYLSKFNVKDRSKSLLMKLIHLNLSISPGELRNIIKTSIAFSDPQKKLDYIHYIYRYLFPKSLTIDQLREGKLSTREIEFLTGISKSQISRKLKENA